MQALWLTNLILQAISVVGLNVPSKFLKIVTTLRQSDTLEGTPLLPQCGLRGTLPIQALLSPGVTPPASITGEHSPQRMPEGKLYLTVTL